MRSRAVRRAGVASCRAWSGNEVCRQEPASAALQSFNSHGSLSASLNKENALAEPLSALLTCTMADVSEPLVDTEAQKPARPQPTSKTQQSPVEAFCAANARKLIVLLLLFLTSCLGFGVKIWVDKSTTAVDLRQTLGSFQVHTQVTASSAFASCCIPSKSTVVLPKVLPTRQCSCTITGAMFAVANTKPHCSMSCVYPQSCSLNSPFNHAQSDHMLCSTSRCTSSLSFIGRKI